MKTKNKGISLITLVITVIVIIILAAAVILMLNNNNPIENAKEAKYRQDIDSVQGVTTTTLQKIMLDSNGNVMVQAGEIINGKFTYTLDDGTSGEVIYESGVNGENKYYTGINLPDYGKWSIDDKGNITLEFNGKIYGVNGEEESPIQPPKEEELDNPVAYNFNTLNLISVNLTGRELEKEDFLVQLKKEDGEVIAEASNDAEGKIILNYSTTYAKTGIYTYKLAQKNTNLGGVSYDETEYELKIIVSKNGEDVKITCSNSEIVFNNVYTAKPIDISFDANVTMYNNSPVPTNKFSFIIQDINSGDIIDTATNDENGFIKFNSIKFLQVGTYEYRMSQVLEVDDDYIADTKVIFITVEIYDNKNGNLEANISKSDETKFVIYKTSQYE